MPEYTHAYHAFILPCAVGTVVTAGVGVDAGVQLAVVQQLADTGGGGSGYLVELQGGLALAAFQSSADAIHWGLSLVNMLLAKEWSEELLSHELCEEVIVAHPKAPGVNHMLTCSMESITAVARQQQHSASQLMLRPPSAAQAMLPMPNAQRSSSTSAPINTMAPNTITTGNAPYMTTCPRVPSTNVRSPLIRVGEIHDASAPLPVSFAAPASPGGIARARSSVTGASLADRGIDAQVLFRGPRLKIGIDCGHIVGDISPATGRVTYRGKVMNRAARTCEKAGSGQVWCSNTVWQKAVAQGIQAGARATVDAVPMGPMRLKVRLVCM